MTFDKIYQTYYSELLSYSKLWYACVDSRKELVHESFVVLFETLNKGKAIDNPRAWLYRVMSNKAINRKKEFSKFSTEDSPVEIIDDRDQFEDQQSILGKKSLLKKHLANLNQQDQILLFLYNRRFSYKEMAAILQMNPNSIGKTLARLIKYLTTKIKEENHELFEQ